MPSHRWIAALLSIFVITGVISAQPTSEDPAARAAWLAEQLKAHLTKIDAQAASLMAPDFPANKDWFNSGPLSLKKELRGKIVILDFWTYCCINCIHVLPDLEYLEKKYAAYPVAFVGVHSAKFENEKVSENIRQAVLRYDIHHPVINDDEMTMWRQLGVQSWPSLAVIGPKGNMLLMVSGEGNREVLDVFITTALKFYPEETFSHDPVPVKLEKRSKPSPLRFPGKIAVDLAKDRLYISDSNHHRIVVTTLAGKFIETIGNGRIGLSDGSYEQAQFHRLQGLAVDGDSLWVADAENHALRRVDLKSKEVHTVVGDGEQGRDYEGGLSGSDQQLSTPWDVAVDGDSVYIAMAGTHQIWVYSKAGDQAFRYSGSGREQNFNSDIPEAAAWAQPSGLTIVDGELLIADSESSTVRGIDLTKGATRTIVGGEDASPRNLFAFGDIDGAGEAARLQHPLGVLWTPSLAKVAVADTYNHRLKLLDLKTSSVAKWIGSGEAGEADGVGLAAQFDEPSGFALGAENQLFVADTNNHAIRVVNLKTLEVSTLKLEGVPAAKSAIAPRSNRLADLAGTPTIKLAPVKLAAGAKANLTLKVSLPAAHKWVEAGGSRWQILDEANQPIRVVEDSARGRLGKDEIVIPIQAVDKAQSGTIRVEALAYFCADGGACQIGGVVFEVPIEVGEKTDGAPAVLEYMFKNLGGEFGKISLPLPKPE